MKQCTHRIRVAEITKLTAAALVCTALALFGGDAAVAAYDEKSDGEVLEILTERDRTESSTEDETTSDGRAEAETVHNVEFFDDAGKRLNVLVDRSTNRVLRVEGNSFDIS